ncbi:phage portal protein [Pediococcus acidilactici]|uniref:phage portal protein n=1 Tax=Pediococcus acidilactici TaxID=1254 RepID=UPI00232E1C5C|nr:phage portal protein [Pediococcus acidilactici]MDB8858818.1 phage portal protein [Pediococcus acidilactici]MDB8861108.1 phage portal protein [Pediococcus acidilactici]MDB8862000.1 phage portal protein [Pediococcus acidilactici]MDB8865999.1 phage portal protein [Pediococcus acidilactici]
MSVIESFFDIFIRRRDSSFIFDLDRYEDTARRAYLKRLAIDEVINFVARAASQTEFRVIKNDQLVKDSIYYHLNVRPNTDKSATDFWEEAIYKLLREGEVLIVQSDTGDLLIADSFIRNEYALYPDKFSGVVVKDYEFQRSFSMDDVIYLTYGNDKLDRYMNGLWSDYGELIGRMFNLQLRNSQIREKVKVDMLAGTQEEKQNELQKYLDRIYDSLVKKSVVVLPETKGFTLEELSSGKTDPQKFDEIDQVKSAFTAEVARIIGVPVSLIEGEKVESNENSILFNRYCLSPLLKKIRNELNAKFFTKTELMQKNYHIEAIGLDQPNILDVSEQIDKLVSSGAVKVNEVRQAVGLEPLPDGDKVIMTKNYTTARGGDTDDNED